VTTSIRGWLNESLPAVGLVAAVGVLIGLVEAHATSTLAILDLLAVLVMVVVVRQFAARSRLASARLAEELVAFRRSAALVAGPASLSELFETVTREVGLLSGAALTCIQRYEEDGTPTSVAGWSRDGEQQLAGARFALEGVDMAALVRERSAVVRVHSSGQGSGPMAVEARALGIGSSIGCPILIEGQPWGLIVAASKSEAPFPVDTETQIAEFANLVAVATAHANARAELADLRAGMLNVRRDLHDGAQQGLVNTVLWLKLARQALGGRGGPAAELVDGALEHAQRATAELRDLARGSRPGALEHGGLRAGVKTLASGVRLPLRVDVTAERLSPALEATAYFIVAEALTNTIKHAQANSAQIKAFIDRSTLHLEVRDDGVGGARVDGSSGLRGLHDRAAALGGELSVESPHGRGTVVAATLPIPPLASPRSLPGRA
jgi:signal transduction histidine kinase